MTHLLRTGIQRFLGASFALPWREDFRCQHILILCYHSVVSQDHSSARFRYENSVSLKEFSWQLEELQRYFEFIAPADAANAAATPSQKPRVLITFDDGYRNNLQLAAPELSRRGIPAAFFLSTSYIGRDQLLWPLEMDNRLCQSPDTLIPDPARDGTAICVPSAVAALTALAFQLRQVLKALPDPARLAYFEKFRQATQFDRNRIDRELNDFLDWDEVRQLAAMGFSLGSHTLTHPILSRLDPDALHSELAGSRAIIESEIKVPIDSLAYPNGGPSDYVQRVQEAARQTGYKYAFAVGDRFSKPGGDTFAIQRQIVFGHLPKHYFRYVISGWRDSLNAMRDASANA